MKLPSFEELAAALTAPADEAEAARARIKEWVVGASRREQGLVGLMEMAAMLQANGLVDAATLFEEVTRSMKAGLGQLLRPDGVNQDGRRFGAFSDRRESFNLSEPPPEDSIPAVKMMPIARRV